MLIPGMGNCKMYQGERSGSTARSLAPRNTNKLSVYKYPVTLLVHNTVLLFANWYLRVNSILDGFTHLQKGKHAYVQGWDKIIQMSVPEIPPITYRLQKKTKDF